MSYENEALIKRLPFVSWAIIAINVAVFVLFYNSSSIFYLDYGVVPSKMGMPGEIIPIYEKIYPFFTHIFIHNGLLSLVANIVLLAIFGTVVEKHVGHFLYFFAYLVFGALGAMGEVVAYPAADVAFSGAWAAVAGMMGAYGVFFPTHKVGNVFKVITINAYSLIVIALWIGVVVYNYRISGSYCLQIPFFAVMCGFVSGVLFALAYRIKGRKKPQELS